MTEDAEPEAKEGMTSRKVHWLLILGIAILPLIFVWFLLRTGHSTLARILGFGWAGFILLALIFPPPAPRGTDKVAVVDASGADDTAIAETSEATSNDDDESGSEEIGRTTNVPRVPPLSEEKRKGFHCLSSWDGSHRAFKKHIRERLRDPGSFEHVETRITPIDSDGVHSAVMTYRAKNGFGGTNVERALALIANKDCLLIDVQM